MGYSLKLKCCLCRYFKLFIEKLMCCVIVIKRSLSKDKIEEPKKEEMK